ncbi:MAG: hypothetical protein SNH01_03860 [Rikenellaceae bacterium]
MKILYKISLLFSLVLVATSCSEFFVETRWDETTDLVETQVYVLTLTESTDDFEEMWVYYQANDVIVFEEASGDGDIGTMTSLDSITNLIDKSMDVDLGNGTMNKLYDFSFDASRDGGVSSYSFKETADDVGTLTVITSDATRTYSNVLITEVTKWYDPTF